MRAIALLSGGLDSILAIRILQEQGIEIEALNFRTIFACCQDDAGRAARDLGVRLTVIGQEDDYLDLIRKPKYGYGRGANPCVDCRIYMFEKAKQFMEQHDASVVVSGEVVGQRPMSQKRRDLDLIANRSGLQDRLLRPLSAKLLPATLPERTGEIDRERLYDFRGRSRKPLIALAKQFNLPEIPTPSTGCALTEVNFSSKVFDLMSHDPAAQRWDFELLRVGRHVRCSADTRFVIGRNAEENTALRHLMTQPESQASALLTPEGFAGPAVMLIGPASDASLDEAARLLVSYSKTDVMEDPCIWVDCDGRRTARDLPPAADRNAVMLTGAGGGDELSGLREKHRTAAFL
jgi:hypothetical protein